MDLETVRLRALSQPQKQTSCQVVENTNSNLFYNTINKLNSFKDSSNLMKVHENNRLLTGFFFLLNF